MKNKINYIIAAGFVSILAFSGCKKDLAKVNNNVNDPLAVTSNVQLTASEAAIGYSIGGDMARDAGIFDQNVSGHDRQWINFQGYNYSSADFDQLCDNIYPAMGNLKDMYTRGEGNGEYKYAGIARVLMAYTLGQVTDVWGDVPFSKAFQGLEGNITPTYDSQESIYTQLHILLDLGIADLSKYQDPDKFPLPASDDLVFSGDTASWIKLAHSLHARFYLHTSKINPGDLAKISGELAQGMQSNSDNALISFVGSQGAPWYQFIVSRGSDISYVNSKADDIMNNETGGPDSRLPALIDEGNDVMGPYYGNPDSPVPIMTLSECLAIAAEVAFRGGNTAGAASAHNASIDASCLQFGVGAPTNGIDAETGSTITLEKIITMKYIALYTNPESWTDYRRTGFPTLTPNAGSTVPRAFLYPQKEIQSNPQPQQAGRTLYSRVWWDIP